MNTFFEFLGFGIGAVMLSMLCNEILLRFSKSLGIRNNNDVVIRWSNESKPSLGGVSFFVVFIFTAIIYEMVHFENSIFHDLTFVGLLLAGSIAFLMGLADDAYNTKPLAKLAIQILCGFVFIASGTSLDLFHIPLLDHFFTIIWVIGIMNSLNMLDNMDGITGTTVLFILVACFFSNLILNGLDAEIWTILLVTMIGAILGFLKYNINPSKIFMGDAGSQFIGLFVAFFSIKDLWNVGNDTKHSSWMGVVVVLLAFTPAAVDTLTVVINRLKKGKSPMVGGKDHTTHHLVYSGLKDKGVWYVFTLLGFISALFATVVVYFIKSDQFIILPILLATVYFLIVFAVLYKNTIKYPIPGSAKDKK